MVSPLPRRGAEQLESRWDRTFFTGTFGMGDHGPKACGPCVALASEQCQANPNRIQSTRSCQKNIALSIRSMHLRRSAGHIYVMQRFVCAQSPIHLGGH